MSFVGSNLSPNRYDCRLLVIGFENDSTYSYPKNKTHFLNKKRVIKGLPGIISFLQSEKPVVVFSAIAHLNAAMALISFLFPSIKFIGRETSIASLAHAGHKKKAAFGYVLTKLVPYQLTKIICQSQDMKNDLIANLGYPEKKLVVISNPIDNKFKTKKIIENLPKQLITVGRLVEIKGHMRIISALSKLATPFEYTIIGDGPLKDKIFNMIEANGLKSRFKYIPFSKDVAHHLSKSDIFLQGSYSEGFPNALLESCAVGTPVLAFEAPGGTSEIIEEGINGYIASSEDAFLQKLNEMLRTKWNPEEVRFSVHQKYHESKILAAYEKLLNSLIINKKL
jgi:glycosyltransferase involved in cell wall biosynthesis